MGNGRVLMNSLLKKLIPIAEVPTGGNHIPYKMQKALIENKLVPCLNMKPFIYTDLLVAIPDLVEQLFNVPVNSCHHVMAILGINRYRGNRYAFAF